jgi:hypothetical protein
MMRDLDEPTVEDERFVGWRRPASWRMVGLSSCPGCGARISWCRSRFGSSIAVERRGEPHTCNVARRPRAIP